MAPHITFTALSCVLLLLQALFLSGTFAAQDATSDLVALQKALIECNNAAYSHKRVDITAAYSTNQPAPSLKIAGMWWSEGKPRVPITLTTHLTIDRTYQLMAQCRSWKGPLSAAIFMAIVQEESGPLTAANVQLLKDAVDRLSRLSQAVKIGGADVCQLDMMLAFEVYTNRQVSAMYPFNTVRNLARLQARTPLIGLFDADLLPSASLFERFSDPQVSKHLMEQIWKKQVYIVPAFETYINSTDADALAAELLVSKSKANLLQAVKLRMAIPFNNFTYPGGHNATNFNKWMSSDEEYTIKYQARMEPWVFCDRRAPPWHDTRFRGYGGDKIVHLAALNATGYNFLVDPGTFLIHRAHPATGMKDLFIKDKFSIVDWKTQKVNTEALKATETSGKANVNLFLRSSKLEAMAKKAMDEGNFEPMLDTALKSCLATLSWWT